MFILCRGQISRVLNSWSSWAFLDSSQIKAISNFLAAVNDFTPLVNKQFTSNHIFNSHCQLSNLYLLIYIMSCHYHGIKPICTLQWCHNEHNAISNHQHLKCILNRLFRHRSKRTSNLRVTGLCEGNSTVTAEFPSQRASNVQNVSIWWGHHLKFSPWS